MADLSTSYLGLQIKNPIVAASCGLTGNVKTIVEMEKNGVAAVVLKSIFEEEITFEFDALLQEAGQMGYHPEAMDYFDYHLREKKLENFLKLIREVKSKVSIPVIASINCVSTHEWESFAKRMETAGADALELNMFILPTMLGSKSEDIEASYFETIEKVRSHCSIPIALKISPYFSNLATMIQRLSHSGIKGLVLFNRFFSPDFDIEKLQVSSSFLYSSPDDIYLPLRWISIMAKRVDCDLIATTGIHDGKSVIKQILAGATAVQVASAFYKNGVEHVAVMLKDLEAWMRRKEFNTLKDCRGLLSQKDSTNPAVYERVQFMKYFSENF